MRSNHNIITNKHCKLQSLHMRSLPSLTSSFRCILSLPFFLQFTVLQSTQCMMCNAIQPQYNNKQTNNQIQYTQYTEINTIHHPNHTRNYTTTHYTTTTSHITHHTSHIIHHTLATQYTCSCMHKS